MKCDHSKTRLVLQILCALALPSAVAWADTATYTTAGTFTWTCPAGVTSVQAECWGAGGAGGSATVNTTCGGGGGGGGYSKGNAVSVNPGTGYTVTVGAAGTPTTPTTGTYGNPGGDSWFKDSSTVLAKGGNGGGNAATSGARGTGGAGGAAASGLGDVKYSGGTGANAPSSSAYAGCGAGSAGTAANGNNGPSSGGTGAAAVTGGGPGGNPNPTSGTSANGQAPVSGPGGGGGGSRSSGSAKSGGNGWAGQVILTYTVAYDHVNVETAADGSGSIVPAQNVSAGSAITVYAIGRAADNSFMSNAPAIWSLVNKSGGVVDGDLVPSGDSRSATFTAHLSGSANIEAVIGTATANTSGLITVPATGVVGAWAVDADGNWSDVTKWSSNPSFPSVAGDTAILGAGSALRTVTLDANESVGTLNLTNANSFVLSGGNTLTMDNAGGGALILATDGSANAIQTPVALNDNTALSVGGGKTLAVSGVIANTATAEILNVNGPGTTILSVANTYGPASSGTVGTMLSGGGTLRIGNNSSLGAGDVSVSGLGGTLQAGAAGMSVANNISIALGTTATVDNNGNNVALNGVISGSGSLAKVGNGVLTLSVVNTYSGSTTVGAGTLSISSDANLGTAPASATANSLVLGSSTADLLFTGSATLNANRGVGIGSALGATGSTAFVDVAGGQTATINGIIASAGNTGANGLTVNSGAGNNGTLVLGGANTFNGTTIIDAGTLTLANSAALQGSTLDYDNQGGSLSFGSLTAATLGGLSGAQSLSLLNGSSAAVALTVGANNSSTTYSGSLSGAGASLTKSGTGTLILTGDSSLMTGSSTVSAGVLQLNAGAVLNLSSGAASVSSVSGAQLVVAGGTLTAANLSSIGKPSAGLLISSGSATFNGGLNVVNNQNNAGLISVTGGSLTASSLQLTRFNSYSATQPTAGYTTDGLYVNGGTVNVTGNLTMLQSENSSISARIDSGSLTVGGVLTIALNNSGRWSVMDVNGGTFAVNDTATGVSIGGTSAGNAELLVRNGVATVGKVSLNPVSGDTVVLNQTGGSLYIGTGGIALLSSSGAASMTLNGGTLGAAVDWSSAVDMTLGGTIIQAADAASTAHNISLSGVLSGGALTKTGAGALILSGANTYTGSTIISAGTLALSGAGSIATSPAISVASGATLDASPRADATLALAAGQTLSGSGAVLGVTSVGNGATLAAGTPTTIGTLTQTGSLLLQGGGAYSVKVQNATTGPGIGNDQIAVSDNIGVLGSAGSPVLVKVISLGASGAPESVTNFDNTVTNYSWLIAAGAVTNFNASAFTVDASGFANSLGGGQFIVTTNSSGLVLFFKTQNIVAQAPAISNPAVNGSGNPSFGGFGIPGYTYGVERATSLAGPWVNADTGQTTVGSDGKWTFTDTTLTNPSIVFYRLYYPYSATPPQ
ncbi:MAG TPA: autotransporter-associated beta strand repeat-containing protein [Candidatus Acidoferrum sp.]|nr:autotransporter-associated beta strand repeat-containing protein [Candidatus Acidoferrum sp.]